MWINCSTKDQPMKHSWNANPSRVGDDILSTVKGKMIRNECVLRRMTQLWCAISPGKNKKHFQKNTHGRWWFLSRVLYLAKIINCNTNTLPMNQPWNFKSARGTYFFQMLGVRKKNGQLIRNEFVPRSMKRVWCANSPGRNNEHFFILKG